MILWIHYRQSQIVMKYGKCISQIFIGLYINSEADQTTNPNLQYTFTLGSHQSFRLE